jgi:hypothetical protein
MMIKNWIMLGIAAAAILAYVVGVPGSISAEYSKSRQHYTTQANDCGNGDFSGHGDFSGFSSSEYESLSDNVFCSNSASQIQGDENSVGLSSSQD